MNSSSPSQKPDVTLSLSLSPSISTKSNDGLKPKERGLKLIQLLLACANHTSSGNLHRADACLLQISQLSDVTGDSMQRLATRFAASLAARLVKRWPGLYKALTNIELTRCDVDRARSIFLLSFPYMEFAYATINRTLIETVSMERAIHIIDLGCGDPTLWVPFIQGIADGPDGSPTLTITYVSKNKEVQHALGERLVKEAKSLNMSFQFNYVNVNLRDLNLTMLNVQPGEASAFVSILGLHVLFTEDDHVGAHFGIGKSNKVNECKRMNGFLEMVKSLSPKVMLLVEQESNHNSSRLVDRFLEGLHFYSALFDSIDVAFGGFSCADRTILEEMFGKEIENILAGEGLERVERHERYEKWAVRFGRLGFRPARFCSNIMEEAQEVVDKFGSSGYKVISEKRSLMICWLDRPIYAVSAWDCLS